MAIDKVYKNPTVKQVIFQIQYPNLFFIESKIAEIQLEIMDKFPESFLAINQAFSIFPVELARNQDTPSVDESQSFKKIWEFRNPDGYALSIASDNLSITSNVHKTYNNPGSSVKFRDIIEYCLNVFGKCITLPFVNRIGLRYIDHCPLPEKNNEKYIAYYDSALNLAKNDIANIDEAYVKIIKAVDDYGVIYQEYFDYNNKEQDYLILDFDGYCSKVEYSKCLEVVDRLHEIISSEYEHTIKAPVWKFMNGE